MPTLDPESQRLLDDATRKANWKRWGPYLSERQWGTVREDYSADGSCWEYLPHEHARSRAYRWGEDGLLGICDRECRLCFALALWNERDPILKERLFGLSNAEGNHGEDVKELYYYLDSTPTHSYMKALYKYPHRAFPYQQLVETNAKRTRQEREFEILDSGVFDDDRYFDILAEYAKAAPDDILIRIAVANRGPDVASLHLLPTLWFRNTWSWGCTDEGHSAKPSLWRVDALNIETRHETLEPMRLTVERLGDGAAPTLLFTENETNFQRLFGSPSAGPYVKDAFGEYVIGGKRDAVNPAGEGTKAAAHYVMSVPARGQAAIRMRLRPASRELRDPLGAEFDRIFAERVAEAEQFYERHIPRHLSADRRRVMRQAYAGLLWSKQFYHYVVSDWLAGDPGQPPPPAQRNSGRNSDWLHLYNRDVISMPDKWEYPWYAAWDLAFHMIPLASIDQELAKQQLVLFLREWYMHPNGQLPAYEFNFSDVNPPVHAWACWRVYKMTGPRGRRDRLFLARCFQKLLLSFTWWVNRKDISGKHIFAGGFLGLDNIGVFDRSRPLPDGRILQQADGTAWIAFFCATMLSMALELAAEDPAYEDLASKFFEHFVAIADAINTLGGNGLWNENDGFYYDQIQTGQRTVPLSMRSMVGLIPLIAVEILDEHVIERLPGFSKRMQWFLDNRRDLARHISYMEHRPAPGHERAADEHAPKGAYLLAIPSRQRLHRVLRYVLDENEFLSPYGIRSLSAVHREKPFFFSLDGDVHRVQYLPGESDNAMFGGNSNWRGPIWMPLNYLLIEAIERYHHFYGDSFQIECPTGSGRQMNLQQVAQEISHRLTRLFLPCETGGRPCHLDDGRYVADPNFRDLVLFYEHFDGDTGRGLGASHQTGWTALITRLISMCG